MSILEKYPAPWQLHPAECRIEDANGKIVVKATVDVDMDFADERVKRLIVAAPELLAALKNLVDSNRPDHVRAAQDIIARIELPQVAEQLPVAVQLPVARQLPVAVQLPVAKQS